MSLPDEEYDSFFTITESEEYINEQSTSNTITEIVNNTEISTNEPNDESKSSKTNSKKCCQNNSCKIL